MKQVYLKLYLVIVIFSTVSCSKEVEDRGVIDYIIEEPILNNYSVNENFILKNDNILNIKGIVYVPGYPGYLPWEIEESDLLPNQLKNSILNDLMNIKELGANTVRFWGAPKYCYEALKNIGDLNFIQTIWINGDAPDFHEGSFKETTKSYIRKVVDRIYSVYTDNNPPLIAFIMGNELSELSIKSTNTSHPEINSFNGSYIQNISKITATESFIAEMADYLKVYEFENYGRISLVSYANDIRTADLIDTPFLDFRSHNAYSYAVPYYRPNTLIGSNSGTLFQGWVEELKLRYPHIPLLITETGLSVSPNANHTGYPNYGYGGNTEQEQKEGFIQNFNDLNSSIIPIAGVCIHEYLDSWWKFGLEDSFSQDPNDIEEWFGIVKLTNKNNWYDTEFRPSFYSIKQIWNE